jgi:signal transduction histidine kinase
MPNSGPGHLRKKVLFAFVSVAFLMGLGTTIAAFVLLNQTIYQAITTVVVVILVNGVVCGIYWMLVNRITVSLDQAVERSIARERELDGLREGFLRTVSHELRTPLTAIIGFADLIVRGAAGPITSKQEELLKITLTEATTLKHLFDDLLDLTRITAGKVVMTYSPVHLAEVARSVVEGLLPFATKKGLQLHVISDPNPLIIEADAAMVRRILLNLVTNAIKFTPSGSVAVTFDETPTHRIIRVSDTGIGLRTDELDVVFEKFRQVDYSSTREFDGIGLGLSIVKQLVELQAGNVWVESVYGKGATFIVSLPKRRPPVKISCDA